MEESPTSTEQPSHSQWRTIAVAGVAVLAAWAIWYLRGPWWLYGALGFGAAAGTAILGIWTPGPLSRLSEHNRTLAWLLLRVLLAVVAIALIAAPYSTPLPTCPEQSDLADAGELTSARLNGTTLVCRYQDTSMGNEL